MKSVSSKQLPADVGGDRQADDDLEWFEQGLAEEALDAGS